MKVLHLFINFMQYKMQCKPEKLCRRRVLRKQNIIILSKELPIYWPNTYNYIIHAVGRYIHYTIVSYFEGSNNRIIILLLQYQFYVFFFFITQRPEVTIPDGCELHNISVNLIQSDKFTAIKIFPLYVQTRNYFGTQTIMMFKCKPFETFNSSAV